MNATREFVLRERPRGSAGQRLAVACGLSIVGAAMTFFVTLFIAILVLIVLGFYRHLAGYPGGFSQLVDMTAAYRRIALPVAAAALPILFVSSMWAQSRNRLFPRT